MKKLYTLLLLAFVSIKANAQIIPDWVSLYNCGNPNMYYGSEDMTTDKYGNVYEVGYLFDTSSTRTGLIFKYNTNGAQQWLDTFNYPSGYDKIKIDKSFIDELDEVGKVLVETIIQMGKKLNFDLTAEGIENEEQLQFVTEQGCHIGQGYLFDKPLSPEEMSRLLN